MSIPPKKTDKLLSNEKHKKKTKCVLTQLNETPYCYDIRRYYCPAMFKHEVKFCSRILKCILSSCLIVGFKCVSVQWAHRVDAASIATRLLVRQSTVQACEGQETFFSSRTTWPALGPTQPPVHWIVGVKWPELEVNQSSPSSAEVKNQSNYTSTCPVSLHNMDRDNFASLFFKYGVFHKKY
jgi:hypothetical protein